MRRAVFLSTLIFLSVLIPTLARQKTAPTGSIEGIVVRADTGAPIGGAIVTLIGGPAPDPVPAAPAPPVGRGAGSGALPIRPTTTTGAEGKFSFKNLAASAYRLSGSATGFVGQQYGQKVMYGQGVPIYLADGQAVKDAAIRLPPVATISGKITDEGGQPATGAAVQLIRQEYAPLGNVLQAVVTAAVNDRGEYRIFGVIPGRYYLVAGTPPVQRGSGASRTSLYSLVYYPNSPDREQSTRLELAAGAEVRADIRVRRLVQTYRVRGRIVYPSGTLSGSVSVMILGRWLSVTESRRGRVLDPATGAFEFENVMPGEYTVEAEGEIARLDPANRLAAQATVRVIDKDVSDVVLTLVPGITAPGRVIVEGQSLSILGNLDRFRLNFTGAITGPNINLPRPASSVPTADGRFEVVGVRDGEFRVQALFIGQPGYYVKSVTYGGAEILGKVHRFSASDAATFNVTIRQGAAQINGTVTDRQSQPVLGVQVFLIPVNHDRMDLCRMYYADQNGRFAFTNIEPGDYKVFSWEAVALGQPYDPDFIKIYEPQVQATHVAEGSNQTIGVKIFPAQ